MSTSFLLAGDPRSIWKRYIVAILLVAGLILTSHLAPRWSMDANAKNADLINVSGRQRMLSQRILVLSSQLAEQYDEEISTELNETIQRFSATQNKLANNSRVRSRLSEIYDAPNYLNDRVRKFSLLALVVADSEANTIDAYRKLRAFDANSLLSDLDAAVAGLEAMAVGDVQRLKVIQHWSLYVALLILLLEAVLIFLPAQLSVTRFIGKLEEKTEALRKANKEAQIQNRSLIEMQEQIEIDRRRDDLTGLSNRRGIEQALAALIQGRDADHADISVFHMDLDGFRLINDAYGQTSGDLVLKHVAQLIQECTPNSDLIARVGSDEFLVILNAQATSDELIAFASALKQVIERPIDIGSAKCHIGASVGIASTNLDACSPEKLFTFADIALSKAKTVGGGRSVLFEVDLLEEVNAQKDVATELDAAFVMHQFEVYYQPIFCSRTRVIKSLEALVRWKHPERGIQSAGQFMDHIHRLGLSSKLDQFVLSCVLEHIALARAEGVSMPSVAINVSAASLMDTDYLQRVSECSIPKSGISLEISESVDFERHIEHITKRVAQFEAKGISIEIDDFGTGHASLYSFKRLRPAKIKIARELILDVETAQDTRKMVQTICTLAKSFDSKIVAEGVENEDMATALTLLGCDYLQGFGLCRPKSFEDTFKQLQAIGSAKGDDLEVAA